MTRFFLPMVVASGARSAGALGGRPRCESGGDRGCQMGWDPRRAGRRGQTPDTPGDPRKRAPGFVWRGTARLAARFPVARGRTPAVAVGRGMAEEVWRAANRAPWGDRFLAAEFSFWSSGGGASLKRRGCGIAGCGPDGGWLPGGAPWPRRGQRAGTRQRGRERPAGAFGGSASPR